MNWLAAIWYLFFPKAPADEGIRELEAEEILPAEPDEVEPEPEPEVEDPEPEPEPEPDEARSIFEPKLMPPSSVDTVTDTPPPVIKPDVEPEIEAPGIRFVGAWAGKSSIRRGQKDIDFCLKYGINRIDLIVNDHSKWRSKRPFDTYELDDIIEFAKLVTKAGIELHLMSWIMPHAGYITQAADVLIKLCEETGAKSLQWDAEEPWTQAKTPMDYDEAAALVAEKFKELPCPMGVNGIGYTPISKFGPLAAVCDHVIPQCYSTKTSGIRPDEVVPRLYRRWKKVFNHPKHHIGLAAYRQYGIPGFSTASALRTALAGAQTLEGIDTVIYWSLTSIRKSRSVRNFIKSIPKVESAGIAPGDT